MEPLRVGDKYNIAYSRTHILPERCEICGRNHEECSHSWTKRSNLIYTDHCHYHGVVRGALCHECNVWEGAPRKYFPELWKDHRNRYAQFHEWQKRCVVCAENYDVILKVYESYRSRVSEFFETTTNYCRRYVDSHYLPCHRGKKVRSVITCPGHTRTSLTDDRVRISELYRSVVPQIKAEIAQLIC